MKQLFSILLIGMFCVSASSFKPINAPKDPTRIQVIFNCQLEFNDLVKIKLDLSQKGITIDYKMVAFDKYGKLKSIDFFVDCRDGFSGSANEANLSNQSRIGFYRDYSKDAKSPFGTGVIDEETKKN